MPPGFIATAELGFIFASSHPNYFITNDTIISDNFSNHLHITCSCWIKISPDPSHFPDLINTMHYFSISENIIYAIFAIVASVVFIVGSTRRKKLPPGPVGLPGVGYLPFLGQAAHLTLNKLGKRYGPLFSLYLGPHLVVVLENLEAVKQGLSNVSTLNRPKDPPNHLLPDTTNLTVCSGQTWKEQRQFTLHTLRHLGMGKSKMETAIQEELRRLVSEIDSHHGNVIDLNHLLLASISNNMLTLLTGSPLGYHETDKMMMNEAIHTMTAYFRPTSIHAYFPWLKPWLTRFKIWGYDTACSCLDTLGGFIEHQIEKHKMEWNSGDNYIYKYLSALATDPKPDSFTSEMLKGNVQTLLGAGSAPATATVEWALVSMIRYPQMRKRVQEEVDSVLGRDRSPTWADHKAMPYLMAVIYEVWRYYTVMPISMLRGTATECKIGDYVVPKDTIVLTNIWSVHHDPSYWRDPEIFDPERFLEQGELVRHPALIPFSYGKRNCLGEDMAQMEVFLYFATLVQRYSVDAPEGGFRHLLGIANQVITNNICLKIRA